MVEGKVVKAGNLKLLNGMTISKRTCRWHGAYLNKGSTVIYIVIDEVPAGYLVLSDTVREESKDMIAALGRIGVRPVLLTGDNQHAANAIAGQLGIRMYMPVVCRRINWTGLPLISGKAMRSA